MADGAHSHPSLETRLMLLEDAVFPDPPEPDPDPEPEPDPPPPAPDPPPATGGQNAYFDAQVASPAFVAGYSLRSQAEIDLYSKKGGTQDPASQNSYVMYDPARDMANVHFNAGDTSLDKQVEVPTEITTHDDGATHVLTWDFTLDPNMLAEGPSNGLLRYKMFKLKADHDTKTMLGYLNCVLRLNVNPPHFEWKTLISEAKGISTGPNVVKRDPMTPAVEVEQRFGVRTRVWIAMAHGPQEDTAGNVDDTISIWVADELTDPINVVDALQIEAPWHPGNGIGLKKFNVHFNSSQDRINGGPMDAWVSNILLLKNPDLNAILVKP